MTVDKTILTESLQKNMDSLNDGAEVILFGFKNGDAIILKDLIDITKPSITSKVILIGSIVGTGLVLGFSVKVIKHFKKSKKTGK